MATESFTPSSSPEDLAPRREILDDQGGMPDDRPTRSPRPSSTEADVDSTDPRETTDPLPPGRRRLWAWTIAAAVAAAIGAWAVSETGLVRVAPAAETFRDMGHNITHSTVKSREAAEVATAIRSYAVLGMTLGFALGLAGGLSRRSARAAAVASATGLVAGALLGGGSAALGLLVYRRVRYDLPSDLVASTLAHAWIWGWVGASAGLALGIGLGGRSRLLPTLLVGAIGAVLGAVAHEFLAALLSPTAEDGALIAATPTARLLASALAAIASATSATLAARPTTRGPRPGHP
jgi:hypothetical protein